MAVSVTVVDGPTIIAKITIQRLCYARVSVLLQTDKSVNREVIYRRHTCLCHLWVMSVVIENT